MRLITANRGLLLTKTHNRVIDNGVPRVASVVPDTGPTAGGTSVTIYGRNFTGTTGVTFDVSSATSVVVVNDSVITCTTPAHASGVVDVSVTNTYGTGTKTNGFEYSSVFDPATLVLTVWVRGAYAGSPWVGEASAGSSGSRNLTEATNPASVGAALNGFNTADFDGTNDVLTNGTAISTLLSASAWSFWDLVNIDAIDTDNALSYNNDVLAFGTGAFWGVHLKSNGGSPLVQAYQWDGAEKKAEASISTGSWALVQAKYDGTNIKVRVNSGAWQSTAAGNITTTTGTLVLGGTTAMWFDGRKADFALAATAFSDGTFDDIKSYVNSRYALSL